MAMKDEQLRRLRERLGFGHDPAIEGEAPLEHSIVDDEEPTTAMDSSASVAPPPLGSISVGGVKKPTANTTLSYNISPPAPPTQSAEVELIVDQPQQISDIDLIEETLTSADPIVHRSPPPPRIKPDASNVDKIDDRPAHTARSVKDGSDRLPSRKKRADEDTQRVSSSQEDAEKRHALSSKQDSPSVGQEKTSAVIDDSAVASLADVDDDGHTWEDWGSDKEFFASEAKALSDEQPERAAWMWIEAARIAERTTNDSKEVLTKLNNALSLAPNNASVTLAAKRIFHRINAFDEVLELTERLVDIGGENRARIAALCDAAAAERLVRGNSEKALHDLQLALELKSGHPMLLSILAGLQLELKLADAAAVTLEQLVESITIPQERSLVLFAASSIYHFDLDNRQRAEQCLARSLESDPQNYPAAQALSLLFLETAQWSKLSHILDRMSELENDDFSRYQTLFRLGTLHQNRTLDLEAAARTLERAAKVFPKRPEPLVRLTHVHEASGQDDGLVDVLTRLLELIPDSLGRAALFCRIGWLFEQRLGHVDAAIEAYQSALSHQPGYLPALQELGTLYRRRGDTASLVELLLPETEGSNSVERRAIRCIETAEMLANVLDRPDDAIALYQRALELSSRVATAFRPLRRLLIKQQRWDDLKELLNHKVEETEDPASRLHFLLELARLQANTLSQLNDAEQTQKRAKSIEVTSRSALLELIDLYERTDRYAEVVDHLLQEANFTLDLDESKGHRMYAALLLEQKLDEPERAVGIYNDILEHSPDHVGAIRSAGRLYHRLGRWQSLINLFRKELDLDKHAGDAADTWCRIGRIYDQHIGKADEAIQAYRQALALSPSLFVAIEALVRLVRREERFDEQIDVLETYASSRKQADVSADALCRAAEVAESRLDDPARAAKLYQQAISHRPQCNTAKLGMFYAHFRLGQYRDAIRALDEVIESLADVIAKAHLQMAKHHIYEHFLKLPANIEEFDDVAHRSPYGSRLRAEQLRVRRLYRQEEVPLVLYQLGSETLDDGLAAGQLLEAAYVYEHAGDPEMHRQSAEAAYKRRPEELTAMWSLQRALWSQGEWLRLAALFEKEAEREGDVVHRLGLWVEAASAYLRGRQSSDALRLVSRSLQVDPSYLPALRMAARLSERQTSWEKRAECLDALAQHCADSQNRFKVSIQASDLWTSAVGDKRRAVRSLRATISADPLNEEAFRRAENLLLDLRNYPELSQLYAQRIQSVTDRLEKAGLLRRHARLLKYELADFPQAVSEYARLLDIEPSDEEALREKADLLCQQKRWSDAVAAFQEIIARIDNNDIQRSARLSQARLWLHELNDGKRARMTLRHLLDENPADNEAKTVLAEVLVGDQEWEEARRLLEEMAADEHREVQVWAFMRLSEVAWQGFRDQQLCQNYQREAVEVAALEPKLLDEILESFRKRNRSKDFVDVAEKIIAETSRPDAALAIRLAAARVLVDDLSDASRAVNYLRECLAVDPHHQQANLLFSKALEQRGDAEAACACYRKIIENDVMCIDAFRGLERLMNVLGQPEVSRSAHAAVLVLQEDSAVLGQMPNDPDAAHFPIGQFNLLSMPMASEFRAVRDLFANVLPFLSDLDLRESSDDKKTLSPAHLVTQTANHLAQAFGLGETEISVSEKTKVTRVGPGSPIPITLHSSLVEHPESPKFRFWVGWALARFAYAGMLIDELSDARLAELIDALCTSRPIDPSVQQLRKQVWRAIPRRVRKQVEQLPYPQVSPVLWKQYRGLVSAMVDQAAVLACGIPEVAFAEIMQVEGGNTTELLPSRLANVLRFSISEDYAAYRRSLWNSR